MSDALFATDAYDYPLPAAQIATVPTAVRTQARLLGVRPRGELVDATIPTLLDWLRPGDLVVLNDIRVRPVRLHVERVATGGRVEVFVLGLGNAGAFADAAAPWVALMRSGGRPAVGEHFRTEDGSLLELLAWEPDGTVRLRCDQADVLGLLERAGNLPLPPYIVRARREGGLPETLELDRERYQTVYAQEREDDGAVAAPTAGLHLDGALLDAMRARGIELARLRLRIGVGTFRPVRDRDLRAHAIHEESYVIEEACAEAIAATRARGGRVVAIGTTVVRALESAADEAGRVRPGEAVTGLMILPGHRFRVVDALLTNFHLPRSTLLALVCALGGHAPVMQAYRHAVAAGYRFYSYGDAMFLERHDPGKP